MLRISHSNYKLNQEVHDMTEPLLKLDIDELFDNVHNYEIRLADLNAELTKYKQLYGELTTTL